MKSKPLKRVPLKASRKPVKRKKVQKAPSISKLIKTADSAFSRLVRLKGADKDGYNTCYTCGHRAHYKKLHAGHYLSRYYKAARWDFDNVRPQCPMCNLWKKGDTITFRANLLKEIGEERVAAVEAKRSVSLKLSKDYLESLIKNLDSYKSMVE